jgi:PEGA domain
MRIPKALLILSLLIALNGCATIMHGTTQDIEITTDPSDARLVVDDRESYRSPAKITMKRKDDHTVKISKEGYKRETVDIKGALSWAVAGDFLAGGAIGYGIDAATGAQRRLVPEKVDVRLRPSTGGETKERMEALEKIDQLNKRKEKGQVTEEEYKKMRQEIIVSF